LLQGPGAGAAHRCRHRSAGGGRSALHQGLARRLTFRSGAPRAACGITEFEERGITMPVYTVHAPSLGGADLRATDRFVFVRDGFHFWAMIFGPFWLLWHRLWLVLLGWVVLLGALQAGLSSVGVGRASIFFADLVVALLMGFEASSLRRWTLSRRHWRQ